MRPGGHQERRRYGGSMNHLADDAILFWDRFEGRWPARSEFHIRAAREFAIAEAAPDWPKSIHAICGNH